jgi:hypothetical protein
LPVSVWAIHGQTEHGLTKFVDRSRHH